MRVFVAVLSALAMCLVGCEPTTPKAPPRRPPIEQAVDPFFGVDQEWAFDADVIAAWKAAGFEPGWYVKSERARGNFLVTHPKDSKQRDLRIVMPAFRWPQYQPGIVAALPKPSVPFAIDVGTGMTDEG